MTARQQVAVVTGGGGGIGAAIAAQLGRDGWFVVTVDPLVSVDGSERLPDAGETTAGRIVAAGGSARASAASVTDAGAIRELFRELVDGHGGLDAVVNVAGISRPTGFGHGSEEDWRAVLSVHLDGYLNILEAALPLMERQGSGRILGVTSGSGWRAADAGAYSCAKRAVAALTWQVSRHAPPGVTVNAMSPIANTRMVTAALARAPKAATTRAGGGLSLVSMPDPEDLGPFGAYLVDDRFGWCSGRVLFAGGSEVAVVDEPRLLEVVRTEGAVSVARVIEAAVTQMLVPAETNQASRGGGNPRFGPVFDEPAPVFAADLVKSCAVVTERPRLAGSLVAALRARSVSCSVVEPGEGLNDIQPVDAVVVALSGQPTSDVTADGWRRVLSEHCGLAEQIYADASWARTTADHAKKVGRPIQLVTLSDATTSGGRTRAQAAAQLSRVAGGSTGGSVTAFAVSVEASVEGAGEAAGEATGELVAHLLTAADATALAGAELVVGPGWVGLRSHPRPTGSVTFGGPAVPDWLDATLREVLGAR